MRERNASRFISALISALMISAVFSLTFSGAAAEPESSGDMPDNIAATGSAIYEEQPEVMLSSSSVINVRHDNSIEDIVEKERLYSHKGFRRYYTTRYDVTPTLTSPYEAGTLNQDDIDDAANAVKMVRYLAGVPYEDVKFDPELNDIAQHGAVLLAASSQFSHYPSQPSDMDDAFYEIAARGCSEANISAGLTNISNTVLEFVYDNGDNNIERAGHRRWILNPGNQNFGIGYAHKDGNDYYQGDRINMHVFDGMGPWNCKSDSYIAWPAAGDFPIQYFAASNSISGTIDAPWSINLGAPYSVPQKEKLTLKLTRKRDGKVWIFDKDTPNLAEGGYEDESKLHLATDNGGYGIAKAIVFRPDLDSLGEIADGDIFNIDLTGIEYTDGTPAELSYDINFFDLERALNETPAGETATPDSTASEEPTVPTETPEPEMEYPVARDFTMTTIDDREFNLSSLSGKPVVLIFGRMGEYLCPNTDAVVSSANKLLDKEKYSAIDTYFLEVDDRNTKSGVIEKTEAYTNVTSCYQEISYNSILWSYYRDWVDGGGAEDTSSLLPKVYYISADGRIRDFSSSYMTYDELAQRFDKLLGIETNTSGEMNASLLSSDNGVYKFGVELSNIKENGSVVIVLYKDGVLRDYYEANGVSPDTSYVECTFTYTGAIDSARVFLWSDFEAMRPLCRAENIDI